MIEIRAFRSDGMIETIYEKEGWANDHDPGWDMTAEVLIGSFQNVQLTYSDLRIPELAGEVIAFIDEDGDWRVQWQGTDDRQRSYPFSDVLIGEVAG